MKEYLVLISYLTYLCLCSNVLLAQNYHFNPPALGGESYFEIIEKINYPGNVLEPGDEIAVFDNYDDGIGLMNVVQFGGNYPIQLKSYLETIVLNDTLVGAKVGTPKSIKIWDKSYFSNKFFSLLLS